MRLGGGRGLDQVRAEPLGPLRVLRERLFRADSSTPGRTPAQEARCLAVGNGLMSPSVSGDDHVCGATLDPRDRAGCIHGRGERRLDLAKELGDRFSEIVDVCEHPADYDRVLVIEPALERLAHGDRTPFIGPPASTSIPRVRLCDVPYPRPRTLMAVTTNLAASTTSVEDPRLREQRTP